MKTCSNSKCSQSNPQPLDAFAKKVRNPDGLQRECRKCVSEYKKQYREKLGEELLIMKRLSHHKHKHKRGAYREKNKDHIKEVTKKYKVEHKEQIKEIRKEYLKENIEQVRETRNSYTKRRREQDINFRLAGNLRNRLRNAIHRDSKMGSAVSDLGCSIQEFKEYIEKQFVPGMSWDNWQLIGGWHLDHIISLATVDLTNREEFLKACHYTNQRPMWGDQNIKDGARKKIP